MTAPGCGRPADCPVPDPPGPVDARRIGSTVWPADRAFFHVYELHRGCDEFNPGRGDSRFAPIGRPTTVPTLYGGADETVALLESVFHDVTAGAGDRVVYPDVLRDRGLAHLVPPRPLRLVDLRDEALARLGLGRPQLVATTPEHYACTRAWGEWLHARAPGGRPADGLVWISRQAELTGRPGGEVFVLWGDRAPSKIDSYALVGPGVRNLVEGPGRVLVEEIAESLDALVVPG